MFYRSLSVRVLSGAQGLVHRRRRQRHAHNITNTHITNTHTYNTHTHTHTHTHTYTYTHTHTHTHALAYTHTHTRACAQHTHTHTHAHTHTHTHAHAHTTHREAGAVVCHCHPQALLRVRLAGQLQAGLPQLPHPLAHAARILAAAGVAAAAAAPLPPHCSYVQGSCVRVCKRAQAGVLLLRVRHPCSCCEPVGCLQRVPVPMHAIPMGGCSPWSERATASHPPHPSIRLYH